MKQEFRERIVKYFAELRVLKWLPKSGMRMAGTEGEGTVGQHVVRAAQIAYVLAYLEGAEPEKTALMVLFHDNGEVRVGDQHKVAARYFDVTRAEKAAFLEQISGLPEELGGRLGEMFLEFEARETKEAVVAKDADYLETALTAKEAREGGGSQGLEDWMENVRGALRTKSAKELLDYVMNQDDFVNCWWRGLKKV